MKTVDRLKATLGANIGESIDNTRRTGVLGGAGEAAPVAPANRYAGLNRVKGALELPIDRVVADPNQPRQEFDAESLDRLAHSLKERGQIQPIRVRWSAELDKWVIVAGERRWRAAQLAGLAKLDAVETNAPQSAAEILMEQLVENCLREDLKPVEQARAFRVLMDTQGLNQQQLAETLRVSESQVTRAMALLALPAAVQEQVETGAIPPTVAYEVSKLPDPSEQVAIVDQVLRDGLTRSEVVEAVRQRRKRPKTTPKRFEYAGPGGTVAVTMFDPSATPKAMIALLRSVLAQVQAESKGDNAAA